MYYLGIDPGLTGAAALMNENQLVEVIDLPVMTVGKGEGRVKNQINAAALAMELRRLVVVPGALTVAIEKVGAMPDQGIAGVFSFGDTVGCIRGVVATLGYPIEWVTPQQWKKHFKIPREKDVARSVAINLFPGAPLTRKKDHNRAEAMLLARYAWHMANLPPAGDRPF